MAEKKTKRVTDIIPSVILVFVLICTVLILIEVSGQLINEGMINTDQAPTLVEPTTIPGTITPEKPTPTAQPVQGA